MTTINDLIANIKDNQQTEVETYTSAVWDAEMGIFMEVFEFGWGCWDESFGKRVKKHWVKSWICTDTRVGIALYSFDGKFIAFSTQYARKSDETLKFLDEESYDTLFQFVREILDRQDSRKKPMISGDTNIDAEIARAVQYAKGNNFSFQIDGVQL